MANQVITIEPSGCYTDVPIDGTVQRGKGKNYVINTPDGYTITWTSWPGPTRPPGLIDKTAHRSPNQDLTWAITDNYDVGDYEYDLTKGGVTQTMCAALALAEKPTMTVDP